MILLSIQSIDVPDIILCLVIAIAIQQARIPNILLNTINLFFPTVKKLWTTYYNTITVRINRSSDF